MKFMILSQPRSRSKWLSEYLSHNGTRCGHDLVLDCSSVADFVDYCREFDGTIETGIGIGWRLWRELFPKTKFGILIRPVTEIAYSFEKHELSPDWSFLYNQHVSLRQFYRAVPFVRRIWFSSLSDVEIRRQIVVGLADGRFDPEWDSFMENKNIQIPLRERLEIVESRKVNIQKFLNEVAMRSSIIAERH